VPRDGLFISDLFKRKAGTILIVESGKKVRGCIIGYVKLETTGAIGKINLLAIDKEFRRMGLGNTLMASYLDIVRSTGCHRCYLEVRRGNANAISLYKKIGFIENGILKDFYGTGLDAISMYKETE
jgi:ribosomal-protein-alanine N-acetyltransferase